LVERKFRKIFTRREAPKSFGEFSGAHTYKNLFVFYFNLLLTLMVDYVLYLNTKFLKRKNIHVGNSAQSGGNVFMLICTVILELLYPPLFHCPKYWEIVHTPFMKRRLNFTPG
jgi:hypothetical protein